MSAVTLVRRAFGRQFRDFFGVSTPITCQVQTVRNRWKPIEVPKPGIPGTCYRRIVHFKDEYTVEPLNVTNLGGRDPVTGRVVAKGIGGGIKHKYHWINWRRDGPVDLNEPPKEEKVLAIFPDGCRTAHVALIGSGSDLYYILATENMKVGDILKTHKGIPRNPIRPSEGDAYPLGALPKGTMVNCIETIPGFGGTLIHSAGTFGTIVETTDDFVTVKVPSKRIFKLYPSCMATVGRISNIEHASTPIGSAQKNRELGNRPRSGLWQRKDGTRGRKIKPIPPVLELNRNSRKERTSKIVLTIPSIY